MVRKYKYIHAMKPFVLLVFISSITFSCINSNPNITESGEDELKVLELDHQINKNNMAFQDTIYVPIYSDIYVDEHNQKTLLAATLSIRNTDYKHSLFISKIDYFDTHGNLVRSFINKPIGISPMATVNYVIEKDDDTGGSGANFIVVLNSKNKNIKPIIQAVMMGQIENKGFAFSTDGYSIRTNP